MTEEEIRAYLRALGIEEIVLVLDPEELEDARIRQKNKDAYTHVKSDATFMCLPTHTWVDPK